MMVVRLLKTDSTEGRLGLASTSSQEVAWNATSEPSSLPCCPGHHAAASAIQGCEGRHRSQPEPVLVDSEDWHACPVEGSPAEEQLAMLLVGTCRKWAPEWSL